MGNYDAFIESIKDVFSNPKPSDKSDDAECGGMIFVDSDATPEEVNSYIDDIGKLS